MGEKHSVTVIISDPTFYSFMNERRVPVAVLDTCEIVSIIYLQKKMLQNWKSIFIAVCGSRIFPTLLNAVTHMDV
jgi:hypothetical protein